MSNITLRPINLDDTNNIIKWKNSDSVKKNFCIQENLTKETHINWYNNRILTGEVQQFVIRDNSINKDVGSVYLRDIDHKNNKAELGIFIGEEQARGKGIGTESVKKAVEYGFKNLKLHKIFLRVFSNNTAGIKAYEKAGFKYERTAKDDILLPSGKYQDIVFMEILNN